MMECSDIAKMENGMENGNAKQSAVIFTESPFGDISEFIITHGHSQRLPLLASGGFLVKLLVQPLKVWPPVE